ncbi:PQQ-dependent dehydrogenase, methanol/ethanol family [Blastomonas sp. AAP53]|uniref:PQQ-dependent dehydrogenase, methanol/ethanol family n=1 Tax=Blastomonas sp. AAP53 TaxID=1248760 RepID=UPI001EE68BCF|nr:PQQ-dependent dehydrogenase, methanol/ethanol family [Blastomonas sp. AAP53]
MGLLLSGTAACSDLPAGQSVLAEGAEGEWARHGRTLAEDRFSPLTAINDKTVSGLKLAWYHDLDVNRGQEATPIMVGGILYTTSAWSKVQAFEAATGKLLWQYDPKVPGAAAVKGCCDVVNRGVAIENGTLFSASFDGRLFALDAKTGKLLWETMTVDPERNYTITGAPRLVAGKVLIGNGGGEFGVRGYVSAYDMATGKLAWRFYTVPGKAGVRDGAASDAIFEKMAGKTWSGKPDEVGGGGTVWDSMAYDPDLNLVYIGVGNGSPWNPAIRSPGGGDNLFLSSIVALRPDTGEYVWHYQTTPGDQWDYTATQHMILADLKIEGKLRKVLMQAPKNGYFYVLDRETGKLLSANNYVPVNWSSGVDLKTGRPKVNPAARYHRVKQPWVGMPGFLGGHNWHPMAFSPQTGLVYIPAQEVGAPYVPDQQFSWRKQSVNLGLDLEKMGPPVTDEAAMAQIKASLKGRIIAWDPVAGKERWRVEHVGPWNGGLLATAGNLVFQGTSAGDFVAYDARNGKKLWSFPAQAGIIAPPVTYAIGDRQMVSVVVGWGGIYPLLLGHLAKKSNDRPNRARVLTFALDGTASLPALPNTTGRPPSPPARFGTAAQIATGRTVYARSCSGCHGDGVVSGGVLPELRWSSTIGDRQAWLSVVRDGVLMQNGMVSFSRDLTEAQMESVRAYVVERANGF